MTAAERLQHKCPKCFAVAGKPCIDPLGDATARPHKVRGEGQYEQHLAESIKRKAARDKASYGPLFAELAEAEVHVPTVEKVKERKRRDYAIGAEDRGPHDQANNGLEWLRLHAMSRLAVEMAGDDGAALWANCIRVYRTNTPYIAMTLAKCLASTDRRELDWALRFDAARVNEFNSDGRYLVCTRHWPPTNWEPMPRAEFDQRFAVDHKAGLKDQPDDPTGLFERTVGALNPVHNVAN